MTRYTADTIIHAPNVSYDNFLKRRPNVLGVSVVWEPEAEADLDSILEYNSKDNIDAAINLTNGIYQQVSLMLAPVSRRGKKGRVPGTINVNSLQLGP